MRGRICLRNKAMEVGVGEKTGTYWKARGENGGQDSRCNG